MIGIASGISGSESRAYGRERRYGDAFYGASGRAHEEIPRKACNDTGVYNFKQKGEFKRGDNGSAERRSRKVGEARREAAARRKKVTSRRRIILAVLILILFAATLAVIYKFVFVVGNINVVGTSLYSENEVIDASGIYNGINLYSFRRSAVERKITLACPYIGSVEVKRNVPNSVDLILTDESAAYYTVIFGDIKILSEGLRVLDSADNKNEIPEGVKYIKLPPVKYSVTGRVIEFAEPKYDRIVRSVLSELKDSELEERITSVDIRDQFDISMVCDGAYKLIIGNGEDIPYKLKTAALVLQDEMFEGGKKAKIDLTVRDKTGVRLDELLDVE